MMIMTQLKQTAIASIPSSLTDMSAYTPEPHDRRNPNAWDALYFDTAIPVDPIAKAHMIRDLRSWTRAYLLLPIKLIANTLLALIMTIKRLLPFQFSNYVVMHRSAAWFLKHFVSPEACYLIVRHICLGSNIVNFLIENGPMTIKRLLPFQFSNYVVMHRSAAWFLKHFVSPEACYLIVRHICLGSNIVNFLIENGPDPTIESSQLYPRTVDDLQLYPRTVDDLAENAFLEHDIILYNFVLDYSKAQRENPNWLQQVHQKGLNYESIQPIDLNIDLTRRSWLQVLDLESAIELFKVFYSLCLTSDEFERAVLSLEFDENFGCYISQLTGDYNWNHVITNRNPLAPDSSFSSARSLLLHGIITEYLHRYLELQKLARSQPSHQ